MSILQPLLTQVNWAIALLFTYYIVSLPLDEALGQNDVPKTQKLPKCKIHEIAMLDISAKCGCI